MKIDVTSIIAGIILLAVGGLTGAVWNNSVQVAEMKATMARLIIELDRNLADVAALEDEVDEL